MKTFKVGDYAQNVESGWIGRIESIMPRTVKIDDNLFFTEVECRMIGVDPMASNILGMSFDDSLSADDVQYHAMADLIPV